MRKVVIVSSASGSGKTTLGRSLAARLGVPFVELDALVHRADWQETPDDELRELVAPIVASDGWVIDGAYRSKLGDLVLAAADAVVWIDVPRRVWLPRLVRRTWRRVHRREELWNGNRESWRNVLWGSDALIPFALRSYPRRRRLYPVELGRFPLVRLRSPAEVARFLEESSS